LSANADSKLQFNFKNSAGDLFNIYAADEDEAADLLEAIGRLAGQVGEVGALLRTASGAAQQLSTPPAQAAPVFIPQQAQAPAQEGISGSPMCAHGKSMKLKQSKPGAAKPWSAWFCDTPQGTPDQCKPIDAKTGKPWG
jgi:hypothetical protein